MRALTYHGSHDVKVDAVPDPILQELDDVLKITASAICGSDLYMYRQAAKRRARGGAVLFEKGKLHPNAIISHRLKLEQAAQGYKMFYKKEDNCRKVVLTP